MSESARFVPNRAGQARLVGSKDGPVGRRLERMLNQTVNGAKARANVDTGKMRSSVVYRITGEHPLTAEVVAETNYSLYVHQGFGSYPGNPFLTDAAAEVFHR